MPFPLNGKYIVETEMELGIRFPTSFKQKMLTKNGGEFFIKDEYWLLYPFFDKTDKKTIKRTCNHIGLETKNARGYIGFPKEAIAIGDNGSGDKIIMLPDLKEATIVGDNIFIWSHETGDIEKVADNIISLSESD